MDTPANTIDGPVSEGSSSSGRKKLGDLGEYRLLKRLGVGGMGQVYKAMHRRLEKLVAVKMLPVYLANDPRALARFDREIKAVGRVSQANVVQAYDAREIDGTRFLVMEYVDGIDLSALVRLNGPLEIADACELIRQAAAGLQAVHAHGLIHRDIKPSNLMLSRQGQLKILDLGLARFRAEPLEAGEMTSISQTVGTAEYIAPEQVADSHRVDIRADIYSLGCTMFRLLTGRPPFFGPKYPTTVEKMVAHLKEPVPSIRQMRGEVPAALAAIIERMVAKNPDDRFTVPEEVAQALAPYAAGSNLTELVRRSDAEIRASATPESSSAWSPAQRPGTSQAAPAGDPAQASPAAVDHSAPSRGWMLRRLLPRWRWAVAATILSLLMVALLIGFGRQFWIPEGNRDESLSEKTSIPSPFVVESLQVDLPPGEWIDVLSYADLDRDRVSGLWEQRTSGIGCHGSSGYPRLMLPVVARGDYDLEVEFTRNSGHGEIVILAPVGEKNTAELYLSGSNGEAHGFDWFDGHHLLDSGNPSTSRPGDLTNGKHYTVSTSVHMLGDKATVDVVLDGKSLIHCTAAPSVFASNQDACSAEPNRPGVGVAVGVDATFHRARVRMSGGKGAIKRVRRTEPCPAGQWVDLLARIDLSRDRLDGDFDRVRDDLVLSEGSSEGLLMLPAAAQGSYELEIEFTHSPAEGEIALIVPVGLRRVRLNPTERGDLHPEPWSINRPNVIREGAAGTSPAEVLEEGSTHLMSLTVTAVGENASIAIRVDGKPWMSWAGKQLELHDGPNLLPEPDRIGLVATGSFVLHSARLRVTSGKALLLTPAQGSETGHAGTNTVSP